MDQLPDKILLVYVTPASSRDGPRDLEDDVAARTQRCGASPSTLRPQPIAGLTPPSLPLPCSADNGASCRLRDLPAVNRARPYDEAASHSTPLRRTEDIRCSGSAAARPCWAWSVPGSPPARRRRHAQPSVRPHGTTSQSQPDTQRDAQPGPLGRHPAALAAHRQAAEGREQGAARRGGGQGAGQPARASAARHRQGRHRLRRAGGLSGRRRATAGPGSSRCSTPGWPTPSSRCGPSGRSTSRCSAR